MQFYHMFLFMFMFLGFQYEKCYTYQFFFFLKSLFPNDVTIMDEIYYFEHVLSSHRMMTHHFRITFGEKYL
jgi:hypothetical protein